MARCTGVQVINPLCHLASASSSVVKSIASGVLDTLARSFTSVAGHAVVWLWAELDTATSIDLHRGMGSLLGVTGAIAIVATSVLFLVQVMLSVLRHEPGGLARALRGLLVSFLGAGFAIGSIGVLLELVDALCSGVVAVGFHTDLAGLGPKLVAASALTALSPAAGLLVALVLLVAIVVVWGALMVRKLLVIVAAVFAPVAFSGASADMTRGWVRRWIEFSVALITSKLVLVLIFLIGLDVLDGGGASSSAASQSVTQLMIGVLLLLLGGLSPWMAVKLVHFAGDSFGELHGHGLVAMSGGRQFVNAPQCLLASAARFGGASSGPGPGLPPDRPSGPPPAPPPPPPRGGGGPGRGGGPRGDFGAPSTSPPGWSPPGPGGTGGAAPVPSAAAARAPGSSRSAMGSTSVPTSPRSSPRRPLSPTFVPETSRGEG